MRKYFSLIEAWTWCEICKEMINFTIEKKDIISGLQTGMYKKEYKHKNPHPDIDDPDDRSGDEHTIYVYINDNYDITGVKSFFGESPSIQDIAATVAPGREIRIPIVVKEIPEMSIHLGMLTQEEFVLLKICDGMNTIEQVAGIARKSVEEVEKMMSRLRDKGLVKIIKRA